jgi:hypothetical protein
LRLNWFKLMNIPCLPAINLGLVLLFQVFMLMTQPVLGQKVSVKAEEAEIDLMRRKGLATTIELDRKTVEKAWLKKLKELGKTENKNGVITLRSVLVPAISEHPVTIFSRLDSDTKGTTVFYAIDLGTEYAAPGSKEFDEAKKYLHEFSVQVYREDLNIQIVEADKAVETAVKTHDKLMDDGLSITKQIENNLSEKRKINEKLQQNTAEMFRIKADSVSNKLQQSNALDEINRLRKVTEEKKNKLSGIQ